MEPGQLSYEGGAGGITLWPAMREHRGVTIAEVAVYTTNTVGPRGIGHQNTNGLRRGTQGVAVQDGVLAIRRAASGPQN